MADFNPFNDRLARRIRNSLSKAFISSLSQMNPTPVEACAEQWLLAEKPASAGRAYVRDRLQRYRQVIDRIQRMGLEYILDQMVCIWNQGLFFEVHEHLEGIWQVSAGAKKQALQGMIKAAGVYVHLEYHHRLAANRLAAGAVDLLERHRDHLSFIANIDEFIDDLKTGNPEPTVLLLIEKK